MTFEEIQKVNEEMKTIKVKGKDYAEVNQRVIAFRKLFPHGDIQVELVEMNDDHVVMKATAYSIYMMENGNLTYRRLATDYAEEKRNASSINKTSAMENCSTSAKGRVLGSIGIGIDGAMASYEEVTNAELKKDGMKLASEREKEGLMATLETKAKESGIEVETLVGIMLEKVGFDRNKQPEGMTVEQYAKAMSFIMEGQYGIDGRA